MNQSLMLTKISVRNREVALQILRETAGASETIYLGGNPNELLLVNFAESAQALLQMIESPEMKTREQLFRDEMISDWSRQLLKYVTTAKETETPFEKSAYLQLRYIEVPVNVYSDYSKWRESTIFAHVKKQDPIEFFHAYHTVVSTQPGVMFLSGFSCEEAEYKMLFDNPHYREIVKEAGSRYIVDGENGLYTKIYKRV